ncbi:hypothetical protein SARI_04623 [Salmonella enterica subsp. arizonae serovar 62:z4,z23:-]|uniref:Uncharacterized protein n=1 Tax=Salmonella arizonae (strain ATCC BAA-731 / CDC346-86 / RSK2980) TaxID=41514 RepID=A9MRJ6_SALAR|nr:hypothetical protein SARI_04623 [Salmonella enterica subsp. arizonae serovar 62:z4,z23:-]
MVCPFHLRWRRYLSGPGGDGGYACGGRENWGCYLRPQTGFLEVPSIFNASKRLMNYMDLLIHREIAGMWGKPGPVAFASGGLLWTRKVVDTV